MHQKLQKTALLISLTIALGCFFYFDLGTYLSFETLKARLSEFQSFHSAQPITTAFIYSLIYITVTALSLPGAAILTLAGGALFGFLVATIIISFASTIGATLAFLIARFLLGDWIQQKHSAKLKVINDEIDKNGSFYLFSLRLIPAFPFFLINLLMGLTPIRTMQFFVVSQLGMLPGTAVYVNAGTQLAKIESPAGILSPPLIGSFLLLGLLPIGAKKALALIKPRNA